LNYANYAESLNYWNWRRSAGAIGYGERSMRFSEQTSGMKHESKHESVKHESMAYEKHESMKA
jgi:hypothetical protein